jgi:hypothetical protein
VPELKPELFEEMRVSVECTLGPTYAEALVAICRSRHRWKAKAEDLEVYLPQLESVAIAAQRTYDMCVSTPGLATPAVMELGSALAKLNGRLRHR